MAFSPGPGAALVTEPEPGIPENQNIVTLVTWLRQSSQWSLAQ